MAFSDFSLERAIEELGLEASLDKLFTSVEPVEPPAWLRVVLDRYAEVFLMNAKSRCEAVIFPILVAGREVSNRGFTIYSGAHLEGDHRRGLDGDCGFLLGLAPALPALMPPLLAAVHGVAGDVENGLGECVAQMVGAQQYNHRRGQASDSIFGCVTTGNDWLFLQLQQNRVRIHPETFYRGDLSQVLGVLKWISGQAARAPKKTGKYILIEPKGPPLGRAEAKEA
jgi:hypothetical protein